MDISPTETFDYENQNVITSTTEEAIETHDESIEYEPMSLDDNFDSETISENNVSSTLSSGEPQENIIINHHDFAVDKAYEEEVIERHDGHFDSEEVTEFYTEENVISTDNFEDNQHEVSISSEHEQSEIYSMNEEEELQNFHDQHYTDTDDNDLAVQNNEPELKVEDESYIHPVSEEILSNENSVEIVEELQSSSDAELTESNQLETSYVEVSNEESIEAANAEHTEIDYLSLSHQDDNRVAEQEINADNADKSDDDSNDDSFQNQSYDSMITSNPDEQDTYDQDDSLDQNQTGNTDGNSQEDDNDYDDAVEVVEEKQSEDDDDDVNVAQHEFESDDQDDNVAQHESDSDDNQDPIQEDEKLSQIDNFNVQDSDDDDIGSDPLKTEEKANQSAAHKILDSDSEDEGEKEGDLIADIFGKSDDEDEEFTGFGEDESSASKKKSFAAVISDSDESDDDVVAEAPKHAVPARGDSSSDEGVVDTGKSMVYDFDLMLQKKKEERRGRRRRDGGTFISDADDIINAMLTKMKQAAESDREANRKKRPALCKLKMLPTVIRHLKKQDLKEAFVDMGSIAAIADWLTLLPDHSLPHISIRTELLVVLHDLPPIMPETLKSSGIGRAVMIMFKHPRETRKNKESAGRLINKWSRPIFGLNDNFKSMSRGEREQRDLENMPQSKRRRLSSGKNESEAGSAASEPGQLRPGERGFVMRARVPKPSNKDYVVRPRWNIASNDDDDERPLPKPSKSRKDERLEKHLRTFAERKKSSKMQTAVGISIEGNKMPLS